MIVPLLKRAVRRGWTAAIGGFDHRSAQAYEMLSARGTMGRDFARLYADWERARGAGELWQSADDQWFRGNLDLFALFVEHVRERSNLEVGSGPFGYLAPCYWMRRRIVIDPLVIFTPKSLLRAKEVMSRLDAMGPETTFHRVIGETETIAADDAVRRVVMNAVEVEDGDEVFPQDVEVAFNAAYDKLMSDPSYAPADACGKAAACDSKPKPQ